MKLTGKAKEDFFKWYHKEYKEEHFYNVCEFDELIEPIQDALIIEWADKIVFSEIWSLWDFSFIKNNINSVLGALKVQQISIQTVNEVYNKRYS